MIMNFATLLRIWENTVSDRYNRLTEKQQTALKSNARFWEIANLLDPDWPKNPTSVTELIALGEEALAIIEGK